MLRFNPFRYTTFRTLADTFRTRTTASTVPARLHMAQYPGMATNQQSAILRSIQKETRVGFCRAFHGTSYKKQASNIRESVPVGEAEKMLDTRIDELSTEEEPVQGIIEDIPKASRDMKERVYAHLLDFLEFQGYPATEAGGGFRAAQTSDLVLYTIGPLLSDFRRSTGRNIRLEREHDVLSFVVIENKSVTEEKFVLVIEGNKSSFEESMKMCLLSLKYAVGRNWRDNKNIGKVYGFVTTGESWQMVSYDGQDYCVSRKMNLLFRGMEKEKETWLKHHSCVVDCLYVALSQGGCDDANDPTIEGC